MPYDLTHTGTLKQQMNKQTKNKTRPTNTENKLIIARGEGFGRLGKMGEGHRGYSDGMTKSQEKKTQHTDLINDTVRVMYGDRWQPHCGELSTMYNLVESLQCTPETNVTLCVTYTQFFKICSVSHHM